MADLERGTRPRTKWLWLGVPVVALLLGVLLGLLVPYLFRWQWPASPPAAAVGPALPFVLSDWEYPGAKSLSKLEGGSSVGKDPMAAVFVPNLYAYSTPDALETV